MKNHSFKQERKGPYKEIDQSTMRIIAFDLLLKLLIIMEVKVNLFKKIEKNVPVHKIQAKWNTICAKKSKTDLKFQKKTN